MANTTPPEGEEKDFLNHQSYTTTAPHSHQRRSHHNRYSGHRRTIAKSYHHSSHPTQLLFFFIHELLHLNLAIDNTEDSTHLILAKGHGDALLQEKMLDLWLDLDLGYHGYGWEKMVGVAFDTRCGYGYGGVSAMADRFVVWLTMWCFHGGSVKVGGFAIWPVKKSSVDLGAALPLLPLDNELAEPTPS